MQTLTKYALIVSSSSSTNSIVNGCPTNTYRSECICLCVSKTTEKHMSTVLLFSFLNEKCGCCTEQYRYTHPLKMLHLKYLTWKYVKKKKNQTKAAIITIWRQFIPASVCTVCTRIIAAVVYCASLLTIVSGASCNLLFKRNPFFCLYFYLMMKPKSKRTKKEQKYTRRASRRNKLAQTCLSLSVVQRYLIFLYCYPEIWRGSRMILCWREVNKIYICRRQQNVVHSLTECTHTKKKRI